MTEHDDDDEGDAKAPPLSRYQGESRSAPYPLSRMAPAFSLVDTARAIEQADLAVANVATGKLTVIAEQIRALQAKAEALLERARRDAELHRVSCRFEKRAGGVYHLYEKRDGTRWFSLVAPDEWRTARDDRFVATYRLELDHSFSEVGEAEADDGDLRELVARLLPPR